MEKLSLYTDIAFFFHVGHMNLEVDEILQAVPVDQETGLYQMVSLTHWGAPIAPGDLFFVDYDEDQQMLSYRGSIERSGNSIIQIINTDADEEIAAFMETFELTGCPCTDLLNLHITIQIPKDMSYELVMQTVKRICFDNGLQYKEVLLSDHHRSQLVS